MTNAVAIAQQGSNNTTFRNRIINGNMVFDQRNNGAQTNSATNNGYTLDRWATQNNSGSSRFTVQRNAGSITSPAGFVNYLGCVSSGAYSPASGDAIGIHQRIEGYNIADLNWGSSTAKTITLSFWVYSSLTGTFGGSLYNYDGNYSYPFTYTISATNTWQKITLTIAGPTAGSWYNDSTTGVTVLFALGTGSSLSGAAGSWSANGYYGATGQTQWVGTSGATFYITGVQFEQGSAASPFEYRDYNSEFNRCLRYYWFVGDGVRTNYNNVISMGYVYDYTGTSTGIMLIPMYFKQTMRTTPSVVALSNSQAYECVIGGGRRYITTLTSAGGGADALTLSSGNASGNFSTIIGQSGYFDIVNNPGPGSLAFNAEL